MMTDALTEDLSQTKILIKILFYFNPTTIFTLRDIVKNRKSNAGGSGGINMR